MLTDEGHPIRDGFIAAGTCLLVALLSLAVGAWLFWRAVLIVVNVTG